MVLGLPFAHIPSHFAEDRRRGHDIDAVDLGQVHTAHAKQLSAQVELRSISGLLVAADTARLVDRTRASASGKTRNHPAPASAQTTGLLASCPPGSARSRACSPSPEGHETQSAYADRVRRPEWR